jgi:uncharacterized protein with ParB-like and HNH nuclease domain
MFDPTLNGVLAQVEAGKIVLPAMQRPFVWGEDRITRLIDSLLRNFPLGTALLWKTKTVQRYRRFQKDIRSDGGISTDFESGASTERYLVLDGQQRLTSLFAGIFGSYDGKRLYLDALSGSNEDKTPEKHIGIVTFLRTRKLRRQMLGLDRREGLRIQSAHALFNFRS